MDKLKIKTGSLLIILALFGFFYSCAGLPPEAAAYPETLPVETAPVETAPLEKTPAESPPAEAAPALAAPIEIVPAEAMPERPEPSESIMGKGRVSGEKLALFIKQQNPQIDSSFVQALALLYIEEAEAEGVNHDMAFAQMCLETGFLRFGGLVQPEQNNFCGLGATGPGVPGEVFPEPRIGVRAHIQHLKAYATDEPLNLDLVDPRFKWVRRGSSPTIHGLSGTWAADRTYSSKIASILQRLYDFF